MYIYIYVPKATSAPPRAGTSGMYILILNRCLDYQNVIFYQY